MMYEVDDFLLVNEPTIMNINFKALLGAVVSAILASVFSYLATQVDLLHVNFTEVLNIGLAAGVASISKFFLTTDKGNVAGLVPVPPIK